MVNDLKYYDGQVQSIDRIPQISKPSTPPRSKLSPVAGGQRQPPSKVD